MGSSVSACKGMGDDSLGKKVEVRRAGIRQLPDFFLH